MEKILFLDFDGVLFDTVYEAYNVAINTKSYKSVSFHSDSFEKFSKYRSLVGPAWNYFYIMKSIKNNLLLQDNYIFKNTIESKEFEIDFFNSRKCLKEQNYKKWLNFNKKYIFLDKLEQTIEELNICVYIITTKDKQTVEDLLIANNIKFINSKFIFGKDMFSKYGSKSNIISNILHTKIYKAIFIDDLYSHLELCENINNLQLIQPNWGYINKNNNLKYLTNMNNTLEAIIKL
jgi:hypothetical protein